VKRWNDQKEGDCEHPFVHDVLPLAHLLVFYSPFTAEYSRVSF
jgi:hypothetical protein